MDVRIEERWTFEQALGAAWDLYRGSGKSSKGARNTFLEAWGNVVGRERASAEIDRVIGQHANPAAAAAALDLSEYSLKSLRRLFDRLPDRSLAEGLTLYFNTRLTPVDRFLIDGVIFGILGLGTDCHVSEFKEQGESAIVRLVARDPDDLVKVAEALHQRVWTAQEQAQTQALARLGDVLQLRNMGGALTSLVNRMDRAELWLKDHDILHLLATQGDAHYKEQIENMSTPTGVKVAKAGLKLARKWLLKDADDIVHGELKDAAVDLLPEDS